MSASKGVGMPHGCAPKQVAAQLVYHIRHPAVDDMPTAFQVTPALAAKTVGARGYVGLHTCGVPLCWQEQGLCFRMVELQVYGSGPGAAQREGECHRPRQHHD